MKNPRKEMMLQNTAQGIMVHYFKHGKPDPDIVALFGTHILLSAFTSGADMAEAVAEISRLNPDCTVSSI